ncbi:MAG: exopolyphosphatase, partial [Hydrogenophilales bacterium RIFOXYD1_FULL_62_11]
ETVRLAGGLTDDKQLDEATQTRALACLHRFGERLRGLSPEAIRCVGTSSLRIAKNADVFIPKAEIALGHPIEIVAGREEARLIYLGVAHSLTASPDKRLVVDIGGGSTEFIIGQGLKPLARESLHMGCVNFSRRFFADGVLDKTALKTAEMAARAEVERITQEFAHGNWQQAIGSSGTARALREILELNGLSDNGITAQGLAQLRSLMVKAGHIDALDLAGLTRDRRPVIAGGFAIMMGLFSELGIEQMDVAETAMREGILYDLLGRLDNRDVRGAAVAATARRYGADARHADAVERTALKSLAQVAMAWQLPRTLSATLLGWAAQLHEIGLVIAHDNHHKHGEYILANGDLRG